MSERYRQLNVERKRLYFSGSPIVLEASALLKDNVTGEVFAQLKFKNISKKAIKALTVSLECLDVTGNELQWVESFQFLDLDIPRDWAFGQNTPIPLPDKNTRSFTVIDTIVVFSDDSIWTPDDAIWEELPEETLLVPELGDCGLLDQYKRDVTEDATFYPREYKDLWECACGYENRDDEEECHKCGAPKAVVFGGLDIELLKSHKEEYDKEQAEKRAAEEAEKQEKRERNIAKLKEKIPLANSSRKSRVIAVTVVFLALIAAIVVLLFTSKTICFHNWSDPTCTAAKICANCGRVEGEPLAHTPGEYSEWEIDYGDAARKREALCTRCGTVAKTDTKRIKSFVADGRLTIYPYAFAKRFDDASEKGKGHTLYSKEEHDSGKLFNDETNTIFYRIQDTDNSYRPVGIYSFLDGSDKFVPIRKEFEENSATGVLFIIDKESYVSPVVFATIMAIDPSLMSSEATTLAQNIIDGIGNVDGITKDSLCYKLLKQGDNYWLQVTVV